MISDVINSVKARLYERNSSPLLGAFIISWCIWNFRFLMVVFSETNIQDKILLLEDKKSTYIDYFVFDNCTSWKLLFCDISPYLIQGILLPLASSILFILAYPKPAKWIYSYWRKEQKKLKEEKQKIEDDELLTVEDSRKIRQDLLIAISETEVKYEKQIKKLELENDELESTVKKHNEYETKLDDAEGEKQKLIREIVVYKSKLEESNKEVKSLLNIIEKTAKAKESSSMFFPPNLPKHAVTEIQYEILEFIHAYTDNKEFTNRGYLLRTFEKFENSAEKEVEFELDELQAKGLLEYIDEIYYLTDKGMQIFNEIRERKKSFFKKRKK